MYAIVKKNRAFKPGFGGPEGIRTLGLYSAIVALSQLSYRPKSERYGSPATPCCQASHSGYSLSISTDAYNPGLDFLCYNHV